MKILRVMWHCVLQENVENRDYTSGHAAIILTVFFEKFMERIVRILFFIFARLCGWLIRNRWTSTPV
jgi:hypothetical protein